MSYLGIAKQSEGRERPVHIILVLVQDALLGGGFAYSQCDNYLLALAFRRTRIPKSNPKTST